MNEIMNLKTRIIYQWQSCKELCPQPYDEEWDKEEYLTYSRNNNLHQFASFYVVIKDILIDLQKENDEEPEDWGLSHNHYNVIKKTYWMTKCGKVIDPDFWLLKLESSNTHVNISEPYQIIRNKHTYTKVEV